MNQDLNKINMPNHAMVLSAGLGTRMRPLTENCPKPLIKVNGTSLLDHNLNQVENAGIENAVVNIHYLGEQIISHLAKRPSPQIAISDEREELLDSGGGIKAALPLLSNAPFFILNSDSFWVDRQNNTLQEMAKFWQQLNNNIDILLLLVEKNDAIGFDGPGDFFQNQNGTLVRRGENETAPLVYAGCALMRPEIFCNTNEKKFSLNQQFNAAIKAQKLYGMTLSGLWLHVGTPDAITLAEQAILLRDAS